MAQDQEASQSSQTEEPVRERLEKTTIAKSSAQAEDKTQLDAADRGRGPTKKRSHEELEDTAPGEKATIQPARHHSRKRSRGSSPDEIELNNGSRKSGEKPRTGSHDVAFAEDCSKPEATVEEKDAAKGRSATPERRADKRAEATVEDMTSPKTKRSRLHSTAQAESTEEIAPEGDSLREAMDSTNAPDPKDKGLRKPSAEEPAKIPPGSGFANASTTSPFGALAGSLSPSKAEEPQNPSSAFAASGFGALSKAPTSGFGAVSKSTGGFGIGGSFATGSKSPSKSENDSKAPEKLEASAGSAFGGKLGAASPFSSAASSGSQGFGSGSSGFAKIGSGSGFGSGSGGFSSLGGGGSGLTSFASGKSSILGGSKATKPFGAPADEDDDNDDNEDDQTPEDSAVRSPLNQEEDPKDERFFARDLETGEEEEETHFSARAKLYVFATLDDNGGNKEWRERGLGTVRLNIHAGSGDEAEEGKSASKKARLVMRAEGSHRVVLNTPVKKEIHFGSSKGGPPESGYMFFQGVIDGRNGLQLLQLKMKQQNALDLHEKIEEFKKLL